MARNGYHHVASCGRRPVRVVIADDHELARAGLRSMLAGEPDLEVIGEVSTGREALELCRRTRPDLLLIDVRMPELDGIETTRAVRAACPATAVVVVTIYENPDYLRHAMKAGAVAYVLKDATRQQVIGAIRRVLSGETLLTPDLARRALDRPRQVDRLTPREHDVLRLLATGQTNREIARHLGLSVGTVKIHVEHIIAKLGAADRTAAAVRAIELGLLAPPSA